MQNKNPLIILLAAICLGGLAWMYLGDSQAATVEWGETDEVALSEEEGAAELRAENSEGDGEFREEFSGQSSSGNPTDEDDDARPMIRIVGRVVTKSGSPVAKANVALSARGRNRRSTIRKEVVTESDGSFSFAGRGYTRVRITLQVSHSSWALETKNKSFNDASGELDMGEITLITGGTVSGSITDMQGNLVPDAEVRLKPRRGRGSRWGRSRDMEKYFPPAKVAADGTYKITHIKPGSYEITASAPHRQRNTQGPITVYDEREEPLQPIQLGPGFELMGTVFTPESKGLAKADVRIRGKKTRTSENSQSDAQGRFSFDHLPPDEYSVTTNAEGFLRNRVEGVRVTETAPLVIHLEPGLRLTGIVVDSVSGAPVLSYAARAQRLNDLPDPERDAKRAEADEKRQEVFALLGQRRELADGPESAAAKAKINAQLKKLGIDDNNPESMARMFRGLGDRGRGTRGRGGRGNRGRSTRNRGRGGFRRGNDKLPEDPGDVKPRPNGEFSFEGLEEGVWVVDIGSPDHTKIRSMKVELRKGSEAQPLQLVIDRGLEVSGTVIARIGKAPLSRANVELRLVDEPREADPRRDRGRNRGGQNRGGRGRGNRDGGRRGRGGFGGFRGNRGPRTTAILSVRSKRDGSFSFKNAPAGKYVVRATMDGYVTTSSDQFELTESVAGIGLTLGSLARLSGRVSGVPLADMTDVTVIAVSATFSRNFGNNRVKATAEGTYEISGLEPGDYNVRAYRGESSNMFSAMFRNFGQNNANATYDITLAEGADRTFNVVVPTNETGSVVGRVTVNNRGAKGYRAQLERIDEEESNGDRGNRRFRGFRNRAEIDQNGDYEIKNVDAGNYKLTISRGGSFRGRGRRGRGGSSNKIHSQTIYIQAGTENRANPVVISTGSLIGEVTMPIDDTTTDPAKKPKTVRINITLYQGVTEVPLAAEEGGQPVLSLKTRAKDRRFEFKDIPDGEYLLFLRVTGRNAVSRQVYVSAGSEERIKITAGKLRAKKKPTKSKAPKKTVQK